MFLLKATLLIAFLLSLVITGKFYYLYERFYCLLICPILAKSIQCYECENEDGNCITGSCMGAGVCSKLEALIDGMHTAKSRI